jgi:uncharacterized protein DUF2829
MSRWIKKRIPIEAFQWLETMSFDAMPPWFQEAGRDGKVVRHHDVEAEDTIEVMTPSGPQTIYAGDWIALSPLGVIYPIPNEEFRLVYELEQPPVLSLDDLVAEGPLPFEPDYADEVCDKPTPTFGWALQELKAGYRVAREGWNGPNQYVFFAEGSDYDDKYELGDDFLVLFNTQGRYQPGWVPSMGDLMAEDWTVVE